MPSAFPLPPSPFRRRSSRRGVLLLVVLSLLVLFMLIGTAFLMSSNQYRHSAIAAAKHDRFGTPPTKLLDRALVQVLCDTGNPNSAIRYHSLLRDLYGSEGFEAVVYSPINTDLSPVFAAANPGCQLTRYATPTNGAPPAATGPLGPTQGQLIDVYIRDHAFRRDDRLILGNEPLPAAPDARNVIKLERSVLGLPEMVNLPLTKGYFNGCTLTVTSGPARGQSTRIVDYDYIGEPTPAQTTSTAPAPFPLKAKTRIFRFRVMAFPNANGEPLLVRSQYLATDSRFSNGQARGLEIADLAGATVIVSGRPFNGTGAGFNELAKAGEPRLNAVETVGITSDKTKWLYSEIALTPNAKFFFASDPLNSTNANADLWGARYLNPATGLYDPLNPTSPTTVPTTPINQRPLLWKYPTFVGPGDGDESYDAPDFQNMALAMQTVTPRARGRVVQGSDPLNPVTREVDDTFVRNSNGDFVNTNQFLRLDLEDLPLPSYFRPDLENYWFHRLVQFAMTADGASADDAVRAVLAPYGADGIRETTGGDDPSVSVGVRDQIVALKRKISLRPLREDHPNFDGSNPASRAPDLENSSNLTRNGNIAVPFWEAVGPWDVDNDNDGVPESVWVDLGDPVAQAEDGTLYKPLCAFLIVDLDSRLNVNAHGLVDDLQTPNLAYIHNPAYASNPAVEPALIPGPNLANFEFSNYLPHGLGYGPAEISLRSIFSPNLPGNADPMLVARIGNPAYDDYARILVGRPAFGNQPDVGDQPSVWGRLGSVNVRGVFSTDWTDNVTATGETIKVRPGIPYNSTVVPGVADPAFSDRLALFKFFGYPVWLSDYYGDLLGAPAAKVPSAFGSPPDLRCRYALGLDYVGQPTSEAAADTVFYNNTIPLLVDSPYELDLSNPTRRDTPDPSVGATIIAPLNQLDAINDDAPFATADLERILRAHDADAGALPDRLWNVVDAFDPLKLVANQPNAVLTQAQQLFNNSNPSDPERLAAAQQMAEVNRRLVTTDSYDLPVPATKMPAYISALGEDGAPGKKGVDDDPDGTPNGTYPLTPNGVTDDPTEIGAPGSDDFQALTGTPYEQGTIVDLLRYRIQRARFKQTGAYYDLTVAAQKTAFESLVNQLTQLVLAPEILAGGKMDLNRPFGDGGDSAGDGINNNSATGDLRIDEPSEPGDPYPNGIVDDPFEAGEPFLDVNGNGKYDMGEKWIDVDADGNYDPPIDRLWNGLTAEPITFDYTNGQAVPIRAEGFGSPVVAGGGVRNLNSQGRQLYARHLYCLMMLLMDENYLEMPDVPSLLGNSLNLELLQIKIAQDNGNPPFAPTDVDKFQARRQLTAQRIAQWAVNCVDERDADSIMTAFEYDENPWDGWGCLDNATPIANVRNIPLDGDIATDENFGMIIDWANVSPASGPASPPTKPIIPLSAPPNIANRSRGVVWGAERPELLITETLAFHDRRCTDDPAHGSVVTYSPTALPENRDYDLDQRLKPRGSLFVELYNPWTPDGNKCKEFYGQVPTDPTNSQGVVLNRLSDTADSVSGKYSPVWRMAVLRDPLNGRLPIFRDPATKKLESGVINMAGFGAPQATDRASVSADSLTIDPDGYATNLDENAERLVYFTTGRNYQTGTGSDIDRSDDENIQYDPLGSPGVWGEWQLTGVPNPVPVVNQLSVRVPPLPVPRLDVVIGGVTLPPVRTAKRYFIARNERAPNMIGSPDDIDVTIAPILPGRYAVVGSSGLQLIGAGALTTARAENGEITQRFVTPISRDESEPEDSDSQLFGRLAGARRIELWPNQVGRPDLNQVLIAENGGPEFIRTATNTVLNATDLDRNGDPTNTTPVSDMLIDPAVAIPVEDLSISEPVEGYPSVTYRRLYEMNTPVNSVGTQLPLVDQDAELTPQGDLAYPTPYDRPLDTDFELVRNGSTQNYRSVHLERLANPTLPWNPLPFDSAGNSNPLHRAWLPVNPYRTIDSQSVDITAYNGASALERNGLPVSISAFSQDLTTDLLQSNVLAPITATQFLDAPDHEMWAIMLLLNLNGVTLGNSPNDVRLLGQTALGLAAIENALNGLEEIEPTIRGLLTATLQESALQKKYPNGLAESWSWHMYRRVLPDDQLPNATMNGFRQWLHFKSLERGAHASTYFKYPKPGRFYASNPATLEGWAPDVSVLPRSLWKQERPNARLFLQGAAGGIVDASDLKNVTSRRVLSDTTLTNEERTKTIPESEITRNQFVWNNMAASTSGNRAVFDYVMEATLGFANEAYAPDLERQTGQIAATMLPVGSPRPGAPEVATNSNLRPARPVTDPKEIWNAQRQAAVLATAPNTPTPQPSLLQAVVDDGTMPVLVTALEDEFYERRRLLTKSTYPWLTWNDRPLVSAEEILQVPAASSSLMLRDYSLPGFFTPNASVPITNPATPEESVALQTAIQQAPFGHLLNVFLASIEPAGVVANPLLPTGAPNFYRILDYVEVPSRYVGTETLLSPEVFSDNPLDNSAPDNMTGPTDPRFNFQPPFNKVSRQRDPGRVNLNTVTGRRMPPLPDSSYLSGFTPPRIWSEVYDGIMHRYGDGNLLANPGVLNPTVLQLSHFGPAWRDVELSRRGYAQYDADPMQPNAVDKISDTPDTFAFGLNRNFPSVFSNPFRSADAGDLVPLSNMLRPGVEATWLRGHHYARAKDVWLETHPFASLGKVHSKIAWGEAGVDDDHNGIVDDVREAGFGVADVNLSPVDGDRLRIAIDPTTGVETGQLISSGIPLFSESLPEPAIDAERNPGMMYQPMTRLGNLVTTRSNVYAIWVTVGYFEVERAPDWSDPAVRERFGSDKSLTSDASVRARALYDRVYPDGYSLGEELGTDTGDTKRPRAFYIIDRTEPVGFKPGEDLNVDRMIRVRRRIE